MKNTKDIIRIPPINVGIMKNEALKSWKKQLVHFVTDEKKVLKANKMSSKNYGSMTVGQSFASVLHHTRLEEEFVVKELKKSVKDIFVSFLVSNQTKTDIKRLENATANMVKRAYMHMAKKLKNSIHRIIRKGHNLFAIGTGQTLKSLQGKIEE